jgi:intein/homing endonuclease
MKLTANVKKEVIESIKRGDSLNKISKRMGLYKSTIYYYYKKIKGKRYTKPNIKPVVYNRLEGEIVGIFAGDGSQHLEQKSYSYAVSVCFGNKNYDYALYVKTIYDNYFGKKISLLRNTENSIKLFTKSKDIFFHFHNYLDFDKRIKHSNVRLKTLKFPDEFLLGFIKGFLDTDGWISKAKDRTNPRIGFSTTSNKLALQIKEILNKFQIKCGMYTINRSHRGEKTMYNIQIWKESTDIFLNKVKPFKLKNLGP